MLAIGIVAILLLLLGERFLPGRPVGLTVVAGSILLATFLGLPALGVPVTGEIPTGLPGFAVPTFGLLKFDELFPLAAGIVLLAYVEGVSAARSFAAKHGYPLDVRQEFLGLGAANLAVSLGHGYPVAGGLSQSAVNDQAGAKTPLSLVICSATLAVCLLFLTDFLTNLPKAVLAAIVLTAVYKLVDIAALVRMWRISRIDFYAAAIALISVLLLGILQGILLAAIASILLLLARASQPNVAILGRLPGTGRYADSARNPEVEMLEGIVAFRPEASLLYINAEGVMETVLSHIHGRPGCQDRRLRPFFVALHRYGGRQNAARSPCRTWLARHRLPDRRRPGPGSRCPSGGWHGRQDRQRQLDPAHGCGAGGDETRLSHPLTWIKRAGRYRYQHRRRSRHVIVRRKIAMRRFATRAALIALVALAAGISTPSRAEVGQVAVVFTKGGFIVESAAGRACSVSAASNIASPCQA